MRGREFVTLLSGAAATRSFAVRAQQGERMRRVGILVPYAEGDANADQSGRPTIPHSWDHTLRVSQPRAGIAAEHGNPVDREHHGESDEQHRDAEHGNRAEIAALVEVKDQHADHLGL